DLERASERLAAGELEAAGALAADARERLAAILGEDHPDFAQALMVEAEILQARGRLSEAEEHLRQALAIHDGYTDPDDAEVVRPYRLAVLERLGYLLSLAGRFDEAEARLREVLTV